MCSEAAFSACVVEAYSGHRADELPRSMVIDGQSIALVAVRTLRIEEDVRTRERKRLFSAQDGDGREYELLHDTFADRWFVRRT